MSGGQLLITMQHMVEKLREVAGSVQSGAMNVASGSQQLSQGTSEQAAARRSLVVNGRDGGQYPSEFRQFPRVWPRSDVKFMMPLQRIHID